jgi:hypothetical protein
MAHQALPLSDEAVLGYRPAEVLLDAGFSAAVVRQWLCEDFRLSSSEALVAVEAVLRDQLLALFTAPDA